ncbi:hypothetical protein D3C86_1301470 [compost metagenome]
MQQYRLFADRLRQGHKAPRFVQVVCCLVIAAFPGQGVAVPAVQRCPAAQRAIQAGFLFLALRVRHAGTFLPVGFRLLHQAAAQGVVLIAHTQRVVEQVLLGQYIRLATRLDAHRLVLRNLARQVVPRHHSIHLGQELLAPRLLALARIFRLAARQLHLFHLSLIDFAILTDPQLFRTSLGFAHWIDHHRRTN